MYILSANFDFYHGLLVHNEASSHAACNRNKHSFKRAWMDIFKMEMSHLVQNFRFSRKFVLIHSLVCMLCILPVHSAV